MISAVFQNEDACLLALFVIPRTGTPQLTLVGEVFMKGQQTRGSRTRVPVSFPVRGQQADLTKVGGKACSLGAEGIAIKTNCPICIGDQLAVEFFMPNTLNPVRVEGEVAWREFHGDTSGQEETLFTAGIKFLNLEDSLRIALMEYVQEQMVGSHETGTSP